MRIPVALLSLLASPAWARAWRADLENGAGDAVGMMALIAGGIALVCIRDENKRSRTVANWPC